MVTLAFPLPCICAMCVVIGQCIVNTSDEASEAGLRGLVQVRVEPGGAPQAAKAITDGLSGQQIQDVLTACEAQEVCRCTAVSAFQHCHWLQYQTHILQDVCCWLLCWLPLCSCSIERACKDMQNDACLMT